MTEAVTEIHPGLLDASTSTRLDVSHEHHTTFPELLGFPPATVDREDG